MPDQSIPKKILFVGHCGPDSTYLRMAVRRALGQVEIISADTQAKMTRCIEEGVDLILFNRELEYGFAPPTGVEMIKTLLAKYPGLKTMLITNYPDVQKAAIAAGAKQGFGKRELGSPMTVELIRRAIGETESKGSGGGASSQV